MNSRLSHLIAKCVLPLASILVLFLSLHFCLDSMMRGAALWVGKGRLTYRDCSFQGTKLLFKDLSIKALDGSYTATCPTLEVGFRWPFRITLYAKSPHLMLKSSLLSNPPASSRSSRWTLQLEEGQLEWTDAQFPSATFSFEKGIQEDSLSIQWDGGSLRWKGRHAQKWLQSHATWHEAPLGWIAPLLPPLSELDLKPQGHFSGIADWSLSDEKLVFCSLHAEGSLLLPTPYVCKGDLSLDWQGSFEATERLRFSIEKGSIVAPDAQIEGLEGLFTIYEGSAPKWEMKGLGVTPKGHISLHGTGKGLEGAFDLGTMGIQLHGTKLCWENLGAIEATLLKGFSSDLWQGWDWIHGMAKGALDWKHRKLLQLHIDHLQLQKERLILGGDTLTFQEGKWEIEKGWADWENLIKVEALKGSCTDGAFSFEEGLSTTPMGVLTDITFQGNASPDLFEISAAKAHLHTTRLGTVPLTSSFKVAKGVTQFELSSEWGKIVGEKNGTLLTIAPASSHLLGAPVGLTCNYSNRGDVLEALGSITWGDAFRTSFEGTLLDWHLIELYANAAFLHPLLQGELQGQGLFTWRPDKGAELDLDLDTKLLRFQEVSIENRGPLHLSITSDGKLRCTGIDAHLTRETIDCNAVVEEAKIDFFGGHWELSKAHLHLPLEQFYKELQQPLDFIADWEGALDASRLSCSFKEGFLPIGGSLRHCKDFLLELFPTRSHVDTLLFHQGRLAHLNLEAGWGPKWEGKLWIEDVENEEELPLTIEWSYDNGLRVDRVEGSFAGVDASFYPVPETPSPQLLGSIQFDFRKLSDWLPPEAGAVFRELKMGRGYELKGKLSLDPQNLRQFSFDGICAGRGVELFGYQFNTLLGKAHLDPHSIAISELIISDVAGKLSAPAVLFEEKNTRPETQEPYWTLSIPEIHVQELRPSLLLKPGEEKRGPLTPLLIRDLTLHNFGGPLDDPKSYLGEGHLSFINSFKREKTVLDLPSQLFGRLIGLDMELMIPAIGELNFSVHDGFFHLTELKNSYSEGRRSEFFLIETDPVPKMKLNGDLEILIQTKQYVLFKLTEGFMIKVEGTLDNPDFSLQKKRKNL